VRSDRLTRWIVALVFLLLIFAPLFSSGVRVLVDWLWFGQVGYPVLYFTVLKTEVALSGWFGVGFLALAVLNLLLVRRISRRAGYQVFSQIIEFPSLDRFTSLFRNGVWLVVVLVSYVVGEWAAGHWMDYLLATHPAPMSQRDPLFGLSLSFYIFRLPFIWFLYHLVLALLITMLLSAACLYFLEGGVSIGPRGLAVAPAARAHLMILGGLVFLSFAYRARLGMYNLLYSTRGLVYGAGYTDVHAVLPTLWIMLVLCLVTALAFFAGAWMRMLRPAIVAIAALIVVAFVGLAVYPAIVQKYIVAPSELEKERPYIVDAIKFTRQAYELDRFDARPFPAIQNLTLQQVRDNDPTISNVRVWDHRPLLSTFQQLQEIRTYYDFLRVYNDRYQIDGHERQVCLSVRELNVNSLPDPNWVNTHLIYTHGYGICLSPVNGSSPNGLPLLYIKNIPPVSSVPSLKITRPEVYYGRLQNNFCIVDSSAKEFDYPSGEGNVYQSYAGTGGLPIHGFWRRVLFALRFQDINILLSGYVQPSSRIMIYRRILNRAGRLTPFLAYDDHPYPVISDTGSVYWILDAYTTTSQYPYSEPTSGMGNYIRNSVKVTINAYTGRVRFYIADPTDPLIHAYARIFPGVFQPLSAMPPDLRSHIRYPMDFFSIQADKYAVFHMTDPRVFYSKEDVWHFASQTVTGGTSPMQPYYMVQKLPEVGAKEEFVLMVPFVPVGKDNMISWMAARCDQPHYGHVLVFTFPKDKLIYGPQQIESRIDQNTTISSQLTLWNQVGSRVIRGSLLVIPMQDAVLYIEPLYLAAQAGAALPQLKRVIVTYSDHVVMEPTLEGALTDIFGGAVEVAASASAPTGPATRLLPSLPLAPIGTVSPRFHTLIQQANQHFEQAEQDLRQGNWSGYGQEIQALGQVLRQLQHP
jgi:uncharacterized protein